MKKLVQKILNRYGYYRIDQLTSGKGSCGLCGKTIPDLIYVNNPSDNWSDIGICEECLNI